MPSEAATTVGNSASATATASGGSNPNGSNAAATTSTGASTATKQKKTVTFKNILETSDDKSAVRRFYNPDNHMPLVSIMKKESMNRPLSYSRSSECIVRPSILSKILNNNSNIDKLNSLKFRSSHATTSTLEPGSSKSVFGTALSRAFGAPTEDEGTDPGTITFRLSKPDSDDEASDDDDMDDDEDDEDTDDNMEDNDEAASEKSSETMPSLNEESHEKTAKNGEEKQLVVDKHFVLPKRSTRSSRIIKPNKRLLEDGSISKKNTNDTNVKPKPKNYFGLSNFNTEPSSHSLSLKTGKDAFSSFGNMKLNSSSVLWEPRLQFQNDKNVPFASAKSMLTAAALSPTSSAITPANSMTFGLLTSASAATSPVCAVCSAAINSKDAPQSRKFGVTACEVCRKFISKMTKKSISAHTGSSSTATQQLQCKGSEDGICSVHSLKNQAKNFKKLYKERCTACWLKKCLVVFQLPAGHKSRLGAILPANMLKQVEKCDSVQKDDKSMELLSPTGSLRFSVAPMSSSPSTTGTTIKWKSNADTAVNSIKANPLAENNLTFGSTPLLRPAILEKPLFLKTGDLNSNSKKIEDKETESATASLSPSESVGSHKSTRKSKQDKLEKEKSKDAVDSEKPLSPTTKKATVTSESLSAQDHSKEEQLLQVASDQTSTGTMPASQTTPNSSSAALPTITEHVEGAVAPLADTLKRQRIDLKGPRVKHVCRSASIVLGQPLATFGEEEEALAPEPDQVPSAELPKPVATQIITDENDNCATCKVLPSTATTEGNSQTKTVTTSTELKSTKSNITESKKDIAPTKLTGKITTRNSAAGGTSNGNALIVSSKKHMRQSNIGNICESSSGGAGAAQLVAGQGRRSGLPKDSCRLALISIDFWENYDPAEVCQTGFGLIVTETVAQRALCFLCGSTGLDPLIFCACCCEPYHQYCVLDEYNIKHTSFDDTLMNSLLDTSVTTTSAAATQLNCSTAAQLNQLTNRLNWLCPRCTVCYTCNMSSGSKVKCQKCQKNYHTTCLGTSKRLLGADRPLICVNCLKCKSCSTTKVSKFVGNLPMCTSCFKLRKKGNYCPICQKCYDDNDFDLKMMECGDCNQWVHSKCEGLSDEQYNLLSTLPESIEFICKKCARRNESSRNKAEEWRQAVMEEFKASLFSVLKLLSKSRQACALLKLSPRKKVRCTCGASSGGGGNGKMQRKALLFNSSDNGLGSDGESQNSDDVYEFKDQPMQSLVSSNAAIKSSRLPCTCTQSYNQSQAFSLVDIKQKISSNAYVSLAEFNYDMSNVIQQGNCDELDIAYKELLSEQFPWFQNETKACTDALEEDMFESCSYNTLNDEVDESPAPYAEHTAEVQGVLDLPADVDEVGCALKTRIDTRVCLFCRKTGEGLSNEEARLLYCGHDCWVHTNCAMWSAEVFEEIDGSLQNVHSAVSRGRMIKCTVCGNRGATVGCNVKSCGEHYHYPCARSIDCAFLTDKSMYCPTHAKNALKANGSPNVTFESNFEVSRPVYVELDRKRKKLIEPAKVQFHIGSLEVRQLGSIVPRFSDSFEAIVPVNFLCSRLYWSSKEPWKIVEYTVRTTIQNSFSTLTTLDAGRNFTVDHSNPNSSMVQLGLAQIARWQNSLARSDLLDVDWSASAAELSKLLPDYLVHSQNSYVASDENTEEEPQNNADLLPPEIKDAIFEDLPHELLDGISMLDIFMYEDLGDAKTELFAMNEQSKDGVNSSAPTQAPATVGVSSSSSNVQICDEDTGTSNSFGKQLELTNSWPASNPVEDAMLSSVRTTSQAKQRNKTVGAIPNASDVLKKPGAAHTRAWPKLDGSSVAAIKRRKLSRGLAEGMLLSLNHQRSKKEMATVAGVSRRQSICGGELAAESSAVRSKSFTWSAATRYFDNGEKREETSKIKIMQMDGVDDSITEFRIISSDGHMAAAQFTGQVKCERCQCTYRNYDSFQRHLHNCEPMSTSESDSETTSHSSQTTTQNATHLTADSLNELQKQAVAAATLTSANGLPYLQPTFPQVQNLATLGQFGVQGLQGIQGLQNLQLQPQSLGNGFFLSQANPNHTQASAATNSNDELQLYASSLQSLAANLGGGFTLTQPTVSAQAQPQLIAVSTNPDGTHQFIQLPQTTNAAPQLLQAAPTATYQTLQATNSDKKIVLPVTGKPLKTVATKAAQQATAAAKQKQLKAHGVKPIQAKLMAPATVANQSHNPTPITVLSSTGGGTNGTTTTQLLGQNLLQPQLLFQTNTSQAQQAAPSLLLPQTQAQNIISFVTSDGSQNQQLQYISIPTTGDFKPQQQTQTPTFLTAATAGTATNANQLLQGATFLQTDASGNLMLTTAQTPSGLQMLAPLQTQPQVIGTLIQPQTLQLATTNSDGSQNTGAQQPLIIGGTTATSATGLDFGATGPQVILATQPMYYGLETIVQNTVMSSQQFVSTAMPGVLSQNASFSATTTQVFQASKIEPIVDIPAGYVVLNNAVDTGNGAGSFLNATSVLQQNQPQVDEATAQLLQNASYQFQQQHTTPTSTASPSMEYVGGTTTPLVVTAKIPPVAQVKRNVNVHATTKGTPVSGMSKVQPQQQVINKVLPTTIATQQQQQIQKMSQSGNLKSMSQFQRQQMADLKSKANGGNVMGNQQQIGSTCGAPPSIASKPLQKKTNLIRPIHKVEVKPKIMKPAGANTNSNNGQVKLPATTLHHQQQLQPHQQQVPKVGAHIAGNNTVAAVHRLQQQQQQQQQQLLSASHAQHQLQSTPQPLTTINMGNTHAAEPQTTQFVVTQSQQQCLELEQQQNQMSELLTCNGNTSSNTIISNRLQHFTSNTLPTNVVNPLQQQQPTLATTSVTTSTTQQSITINSRPTNRVLPMQQRQEPAPLPNDPVVQSPTPPKIVEQMAAAGSTNFTSTQKVVSKCYAQLEQKSPVYETELKSPGTVNNLVATTTVTTMLAQSQQESSFNELIYEKQRPEQADKQKHEDLMLMEASESEAQIEAVDNGFNLNANDNCLLDKHGYHVESAVAMDTDDQYMNNNEQQELKDDGIEQCNGGEAEDEDDDDDDFSLKMATSACNDHEMSDSEEPAVKEKISKILDNLTNDDCADSIATTTTVEAGAELQHNAGYQQMVEDVLATTATAAETGESFEATPEETAAVEAAASYINEMAEAHELELKKLQHELKKPKPDAAQELTPQSPAVEVATAAPPQQPPPMREPKKISGPHLLYEIQSEDGFTYKSTSIAEIWEKVFEAVQVARRAHGLAPLPEGPLADMSGVQMIGLKTNALKYLIEQLPGVEKCGKYTPKYHKRNGNVSTSSGLINGSGVGVTGSSVNGAGIASVHNVGDTHALLDYGSDQDDLQENAFDCARCEPYSSRSEYDMFSWLASRHRKQPIQVFVQPSDNELVPRRGTGSNLPMAMKYRTLKETYKDYVGVFRSHIHGRGLYCTKDIEAGEMVIEYAGELIRSTLTDKRERYYDSRGIGCYMFKIDDNLVVDATMRGNAARFINHSCEPNCYSKVVDILGHKHIIIFALRRIVQGEELTYDYKFPFEDEKIPCSCGSKRCRKYLN
ncbi:histone-lysine N-methyltransferase trithorax isoform X2 [Scaptodrosophila lebanonensis]|nr:histone-lysine N-methyltransferase trithorax isoform X2 [Scaptodrosophila lebanonensis]